MKVLWRHQRLPGCSENSYTSHRIYGSPSPSCLPLCLITHWSLKSKKKKKKKERKKKRKKKKNQLILTLTPCFHLGMWLLNYLSAEQWSKVEKHRHLAHTTQKSQLQLRQENDLLSSWGGKGRRNRGAGRDWSWEVRAAGREGRLIPPMCSASRLRTQHTIFAKFDWSVSPSAHAV